MSITWNTGAAAMRFRHHLRLKNKKLIKKYADAWARANGYKPQASSRKRQASSLKKDTIKMYKVIRKKKL